MGRSQETYNKREKEKKRLKQRKEKLEKKEERKANKQTGELENMMAYVDEFGNITVAARPHQNKEEGRHQQYRNWCTQKRKGSIQSQ